MDIREDIIQVVTNALNTMDKKIIDTVQDVLIVELNKYEIQKRCTTIALLDNSAERQLKKFIATKRIEGKSELTLQRYYRENLKMIQYLNKPLNKISTYDLRFYMSIQRQKGTISNRTLDGMRRCYSSFFTWLTAEGIISKNPCSSLSQIKYCKQVKKPYSAVEMEKLRQSCSNIRDLALIDFLYSSGCRVSEASRINVTDINFDTGECIVSGKGGKERIVYLTEVTLMHINNYLNTRKDLNNALFIGKRSRRLTKNGIEAILSRLGKKSGVKNVHPHRYRRTLATNLLDRGMTIQDVAAILGHSDLKTTQIYCYISQTNVKTAYYKYAA